MVAEITLSHLIRLGREQGCPLNRQQALAFLNQQGQAFEMWKCMMHAAEEFIAGSLLQPAICSSIPLVAANTTYSHSGRYTGPQ